MPAGKEWIRKSGAGKGALLEDIMRSMPTWGCMLNPKSRYPKTKDVY